MSFLREFVGLHLKLSEMSFGDKVDSRPATCSLKLYLSISVTFPLKLIFNTEIFEDFDFKFKYSFIKISREE